MSIIAFALRSIKTCVQEQETYIRSLEQDGKVPEGKQLIHPHKGFAVCVVVTYSSLFVSLVLSCLCSLLYKHPNKGFAMCVVVTCFSLFISLSALCSVVKASS
jgi:hypothetical protein